MCSLEKRGRVFLLKLAGSGQHRLNPTLIDGIRQAISQVRDHRPSAFALITTAEGKFFSNGYDLAWAKAHGSAAHNDRFRFMSTKFMELVVDLLSIPIPTVVAVSGHASAAGYLLVLCHDYILVNRERGFLYPSEFDIGVRIPVAFLALLRHKICAPLTRRDVVLGASKLTAEEAVKKGIVDSAHDSAEETVNSAVRLVEKLGDERRSGLAYSQMRLALLSDVADAFTMELETRWAGLLRGFDVAVTEILSFLEECSLQIGINLLKLFREVFL